MFYVVIPLCGLLGALVGTGLVLLFAKYVLK